MEKFNKVIQLLIVVILILTAMNYIESCNARRDTNRQLKKEMDSLNVQMITLQKSVSARRDTVINKNIYQKEILKEVEKKKDEITNTNNADYLIKLYYRLRPIKLNNPN